MLYSRLLLFPLLFLISVPTIAQPFEAATQIDTTLVEASPPEKSPVRAVFYSLGGTVLPMATGIALTNGGDGSGSTLSALGSVMLLGGLVAGPSAGHFYAAADRQAYAGLWIRGGATALGVGAATVILFDMDLLDPATSLDLLRLRLPSRSRAGHVAGNVLVGATVVALGSALFDVATAARSAQVHNETHRGRVQVSPHVSPTLDRVGLSVRVQL